MIKRLLIVLAALPITVAAFAQTGGDVVPLRLGDYYTNIPTPRVLAPKMWEVRFTHRFQEPINRGDVHSLWGLDSGADVAFGVAWAPMDRLQLSAMRTQWPTRNGFSI